MSKKIFKLVLASAVLMLTTSSAFAEVKTITSTDAAPTVIGGANFQVSTGVILKAETINLTTGTTGGANYVVATKNTNGDTIYTATSAEPSIKATKTDGSIGTPLNDTDLPNYVAPVVVDPNA